MRPGNIWHSTIFAVLLSLLASVAFAEESSMQTGWLELVKGSRDSAVGAELVNIEEGDTADTQKITLAIPKESIVNPDAIEEVVVIGKRPEKSKPLDITYEWVADYDSDNYGLVIRLGKDTNWPIRLYLNSESGFTR
jgi:hypothetical protein